jgi:hypothetical protein
MKAGLSSPWRKGARSRLRGEGLLPAESGICEGSDEKWREGMEGVRRGP